MWRLERSCVFEGKLRKLSWGQRWQKRIFRLELLWSMCLKWKKLIFSRTWETWWTRKSRMAVNPRDMDGFLPLLSETDIKKKLHVGTLLFNYLGNPLKSIECQDIGLFIDNIVPWLNNGSPKVSNFFDLILPIFFLLTCDFLLLNIWNSSKLSYVVFLLQESCILPVFWSCYKSVFKSEKQHYSKIRLNFFTGIKFPPFWFILYEEIRKMFLCVFYILKTAI